MKARKKKLLLIEDDKIDQMAFRRFAGKEEFPFDFDISGSITEAKNSLKSKKYDVIVSDYSLGDGTAFDILNDFTHIPLVITTGTGNEEIAVKAMKLGAYDYLIKDVEGYYLKMLPVTVENAINRFRAEQDLRESQENLEKLIEDRTAKLEKEITRHKQTTKALRIEKDNLTNIFEAMEDGVYIVNHQYDIQYVNPVLENEFGSYMGKKCYEYFHDREEVCPWCKNPDVFAGKTVHWEWKSVKNQKTYDLIDTPMKNADGSIFKLEIFRDITERKQAEEKLQKYQVHLEELVKERTGELVAKNKELERFNNLFVGREFRIKELREEVKKLEQRLQNK